jgi:hypothetical protein
MWAGQQATRCACTLSADTNDMCSSATQWYHINFSNLHVDRPSPKPKVPYKQAREALVSPSLLDVLPSTPALSDLSANESGSVSNDPGFRSTTRADDKMPIPHLYRTGIHHLGLSRNMGLPRAGSFQRWLADRRFITDRRLYVLHTGSTC